MQDDTPNHGVLCPRLAADAVAALKTAVIQSREGCELSLGVQFAAGLDFLLTRKVPDATRLYDDGALFDEDAFDVQALNADRMAASARALAACSDLVVLRDEGRYLLDRGDAMRLGLELVRTIERLHAREWPALLRHLEDVEAAREHRDAPDRTAEGYLTAEVIYRERRQEASEHHAQILAIEDVVVELLRQMLPAASDILAPLASGQQEQAEAVAA